MTSLPVMKKPLIPWVVDDMVSQRNVPSLSARSFTPVRLDSANQARERGRTPRTCRQAFANRLGRALTDLRRNGGSDRLGWFRNAVSPEGDGAAFHQLGDCGMGPVWFDILHRSNYASLFCDARGERVRPQNSELPLVECRPFGGLGSAPICSGPLPQTPGLLDAYILVGVIHHRVEPSTGPHVGEVFHRDPFVEEFPGGLALGRVVSVKKSGAARPQFGAYAVRNITGDLHNASNPQNQSVPFDVGIGGFLQFTPRHKQSILECSLFTIESNVENEAVEVPSSHPLPVFWGRLPKLSVGFILYQFPVVAPSARNSSVPNTNCDDHTYGSDGPSRTVLRGEPKAGKTSAAPSVPLRRAREDV